MTGTVLLVEDERDTREMLARALRKADWRCTVAGDTASALARASGGETFDVVVTDVVLGGDSQGGLSLLTELRRRGLATPVIVMTAFADVARVKLALNQGASYFLEKPFRARELLEIVERLRTSGSTSHPAEQVFTRASLSAKERTVALRLLEGLTYADIAALEHNSAATIRQHASQIYAKCGVSSRAELFRLVYAR